MKSAASNKYQAVVAAAAVLAVVSVALATGCGSTENQHPVAQETGTMSGTSESSATPSQPPIDAEAPAVFETASFALG